MRTGPSLALRAALAVALMVVYVVLSVAAIGMLGWLGAMVMQGMSTSGHGSAAGLAFAAACVVGAGLIAWSIFPRRDKFVPPGPEVHAADQPALFAEIARLAEATGEAKPAHVYVMWEINAFVAQRGGIMGFGSKRVMGLGLPLMRALTVGELRGVVAHELGHFYGGDTKLGPWIYKTRAGVIRTVMNLAKARAHGAQISMIAEVVFVVILAPFRWFGKAFLRITQAVSRAQELSADRVATRCAGKTALVEGLKKTHAAAIAHQLYLRHELEPIIGEGRLPPPGEGFSKFLATEAVAKILDEVVASELREGPGDAYDSHPPLRDRIAALDAVTDPDPTPDDRPAIELVADAARLESELIASMIKIKVQPIAWADAPHVWEQRWRGIVGKLGKHLGAMTFATIPDKLAKLQELAVAVEGQRIARVSDDDLRGWGMSALGAALCIALADDGWTASAEIGEPIRFRRGDVVVEPMAELAKYLRGELDKTAWVTRWQELGLADRRLVPA